jgi:hypothetical protein
MGKHDRDKCYCDHGLGCDLELVVCVYEPFVLSASLRIHLLGDEETPPFQERFLEHFAYTVE